MVAYSFTRRWLPGIVSGSTRQTIRGHRRRHARPGEVVQIYTAMRTRHCRLIGRAICVSVESIRIIVGSEEGVEIDGRGLLPEELVQFARDDGFGGWADMVAHWVAYDIPHELLCDPDCDAVFEGVLVRWRDFEAAAGMEALAFARAPAGSQVPLAPTGAATLRRDAT